MSSTRHSSVRHWWLVTLTTAGCFGKAPDISDDSTATTGGSTTAAATSSSTGDDVTSTTTVTTDATGVDSSSAETSALPCDGCSQPARGWSGPHLLRANPIAGQPPPCPDPTAEEATMRFAIPACQCTCDQNCRVSGEFFADAGCDTRFATGNINPGMCETFDAVAMRLSFTPPASCAGKERTVTWCLAQTCDGGWCPPDALDPPEAFPHGQCLRCEGGECEECPDGYPERIVLNDLAAASPSACACCGALEFYGACGPVSNSCIDVGQPIPPDMCIDGNTSIFFEPPPPACEEPATADPPIIACCEAAPTG